MRWSAGKCNTVLRQWNCLPEQSVTAKQRGFRQQFQRCEDPSHNTLLLWASKWRQEGSVKDSKPRGRPPLARTPDNVERVRDTML